MLTREGPPSDASAWRAVVRVLRSTARGALHFVSDSLSAVLFPSDCRVCGLPLARFSLLPICESCWNDLPVQSAPLCLRCGEALSFEAPGPDEKYAQCRPCRVTPPDFENAVAHGVYRGTLRSLLHLLKYSGLEPIAPRLGAHLADRILAMPGLPQNLVVVPVPLYRRKRRERGFNQAERLARAAITVVRRRRPTLHVQLEAGLLERQRATESQAGLTPHQRRANVRGAFSVPRPEEVQGRDVLIIDDIYTTGATARACATALKRAGAAHVWVATVARAQKEFATAAEAEPAEARVQTELPMEEDFVYWDHGVSGGRADHDGRPGTNART
ncbi:MAG TPA: ComF family protein [Acidobacteriaceae bacterium]|nr:ComF family protein [Acidobacteriaceae bacterium]